MKIWTDGSYTTNKPNVVGWGFKTNQGGGMSGVLSGNIISMRQIGGEIYAVLKAVHHAILQKQSEVTICHDYIGVRHWAEGSWKANNEYTQHYVKEMKKYKEKIVVKFEKIKAGSNLADVLAREGTGAKFSHRGEK